MHQLELPFRTHRPPPGRSTLAGMARSPERPPENFPSRNETLPPRRLQVLSLYVTGNSREEIAEQLGLSPHTVRNHIRLVYDQLGVSNRIEALRWILEQPNLQPDLLKLRSSGKRRERTQRRRDQDGRPGSVEDFLEEAIDFFRQEAIENPVDL